MGDLVTLKYFPRQISSKKQKYVPFQKINYKKSIHLYRYVDKDILYIYIYIYIYNWVRSTCRMMSSLKITEVDVKS